MKKLRVLLSLLFILVFSTSTVVAASYSVSYISVKIDGSRRSVREVPVVMNGQAVNLDIPAFITSQTTFVPIRFVAERYGAEVDWKQSTKTATINNGSKQIELTIDKPYAYVDGRKVQLDGAWIPKLVTFNPDTKYADSRTMVPLRFISETLGYEVGYDESKGVPFINTVNEDEDRNTSNVTEVVVEKSSTNKPKVTIKGTEKINYSTLSLSNPTRLVIDIEDAVLKNKDGIEKIDVNNDPIERINISQFSTKPNVVRVVLNLTEKAEYDIVSFNDGKQLTVSFPNSINKVENIEREIVDGKEAIVIYNSDEVEIKTMKLSNPGRIVMDLMDSSLVGGDYFSYDYDVDFIKGVRVSQFVPDSLYKPDDRIVRVVLDVKDGVSNPEASILQYDGKIVIIPETSLSEVIDYSSKGDNKIISINTLEETRYDVDYDEKAKTMTIEFPKDKLDIRGGYLNISDGLINDITVKRGRDEYTVVINFRRGIEYDILSDRRDDEIELSFTRTEEDDNSDKIIVIDAGHGGSDPGAVPNGIREKDVNLAAALKLDKALRQLGYTTIMTRDTDTFVNLYERAEIANRNQADLFISLHSNSNSNSSINGIQVLYHSLDKADVKKEETLALAQIMMDEVTKGTGAPNKGLLPRQNYVVVRDTEMPSVILEMGFLTNPTEAKKLQTDSYQNIIVESVVRGIERYLETY